MIQIVLISLQEQFLLCIQYQYITILSKMIIQPIFPPSFVQLIKTIVSKQRAVHRAKQKINNQQARKLFDTIDYLKTGQIYLEDVYAYLKTKGLGVSKRQLKFINRYFGFANHQKLNFLLFKQKFLFTQEKINQRNQCKQDHQGIFVQLVRLSVESYNQIQKLRSIVSLNINQLQDCFQLYYPHSPQSINKVILQEILAILGIYSRLNLFLLTKYMIGDDITEVNVKQLFWIPKTFQQENKNTVQSKTKYEKQILNSSASQFQEVSIAVKNNKNLDILTQIQNIQTSIRLKHEKDMSRKQQGQNHPIKKNDEDSLINYSKYRNSQNSLSLFFSKQPNRVTRTTRFKKSEVTQFSSSKKERDELEQILKRSLGSYEQKDPIQERETQIQQLMKNRTKSKTREEVISRASLAAKLKIQQIQKRVFSKNKAVPLALLQSATRTPTNLIINCQTRSRNTSMKKK